MKYILGISAFYHDSAATLLKNGVIIGAFQEERFTRIKQDSSFPINAILQCLKIANININDIDLICYYEDPNKKFNRIAKTYISNFPKGFLSFLINIPSYLYKKNVSNIIKKKLKKYLNLKNTIKIDFFEHHLSHASSAFYPSPYNDSAILCIDGVGEWATITAWHAKNSNIKLIWDIKFPHSLGLLYSAFTQYCGFKVDSGEYKLMGLAPYGNPKFKNVILDKIINIKEDGTFEINTEYFDYEVGSSMINNKFENLFNYPIRQPESEISQHYMDVAASIQEVTESVVFNLANKLKRDINTDNLCMAGGVALNCVVNGKLIKEKIFKNIWIQPASGDSGGSLGAAFLGYHKYNKTKYEKKINNYDYMQGAYLGNKYSDDKIKNILNSYSANYDYYENEETLLNYTANLIQDDNVVGWFQGKMEFGPRALGNRSILGNPMSKTMQSTINLKIKNRESFRPFAPAILAEQTQKWFEMDYQSAYMLFVANINKIQTTYTSDISDNKNNYQSNLCKLKNIKSTIPAVTHVDYSARVQTVDNTNNTRFYNLLNAFYKLTNCPVLINTSFNVRGEPMVESPADAYKCFMRTSMDYLVIGNFVLNKKAQPKWNETENWKEIYVLD